MRRPSILALGATLGLLGLLAACSNRPETLATDYDEEEMAAAIEQARATFSEFKARFSNPQPGDTDFGVKVRIEDRHGVEYFWLTDVNLDEEPYSGIIGNDPGIVTNVKYGQTYRFSEKDVADWMYMADGVMQGNRTLRVLLKSMPEDEAESIREAFGW
jgi:uncharacterized protein YegJ (DUF2314 family)